MINAICDSCLEEIEGTYGTIRTDWDLTPLVGEKENKRVLLAYARTAGHMIPDHLCWDTEDPDPTTRCVCSCKGGV